MSDKVSLALRRLDDAITELAPAHVIALYSGGGDSTVAAHIASKHPAYSGSLFIDTGTSLPGVIGHVERSAPGPLYVRQPPESYEQMIREAGLPGPGQHGTAYVRLKERTLDAFVREMCSRCQAGQKHRQHDRVMWVTGSRVAESERRMRNATRAVEVDGSQVWVNVILDWTARMCSDYRELNGLSLSDVAALIHRSGECNCGTYAHPGERAMLCGLFPEFASQVEAWEELAVDHGHHQAAVWGQRPLRVHREQLQLIPRGRARACSDCGAA